MGRLTLKSVERAKNKIGKHYDGDGLFLHVISQGCRIWFSRFQIDKVERVISLGPFPTFNLFEARERNRTMVRQLVADHIMPMGARERKKAQRAAAAANITFKECGVACFDTISKAWKNPKHIAQFPSVMARYVYTIIGDEPIAKLDKTGVLKVFEQKIEGKTFWEARPETASRARAWGEKIVSWATVRGHRSGDNPFRWEGFLETQLPSRGKNFAPVLHHPALPYAELPAFMAELRTRTAIGARALEFTVLTAARTGAVIGAVWDEIDLAQKVWTVPPTRAGTKIDGDKPRRVPLSPRAVEILEGLPRERGNPHVFIGPRAGRGLSNAAMAKTLELMGRDDVTVHGFRSTFKDWCAESTAYPNFVSEAALWHKVADQVEAAYRRGDLLEKRRRLMRDWAEFCNSPAAGGEVVPMRAAE